MATIQLKKIENAPFHGIDEKTCVEHFSKLLGISGSLGDGLPLAIPFSDTDATVGVENELQTVVEGQSNVVDLPVFIKSSNYYNNILKRSTTGDTPSKVLQDLDAYLNENLHNIWENSWVKFPRSVLSAYANALLDVDIRADKTYPSGQKRKDAHRFIYLHKEDEHIRIPVSYLLKLALADSVSPPTTHKRVTRIGEAIMGHFLNDNTSPEIFSFYPVSKREDKSCGEKTARETLKRFLLTQLLVLYANNRFRLKESGQRVMVYFAPNTPIRQKRLNDLISDAFYRELFMSPCLSGWNKGEDKFHYMVMCHQVLSRSQLNAVAKLKEAGIIVNNLVTLPNTSNTSLTNNGTHISLGSRTLTALLADPSSGFTSLEEKYFGDLAIKIMEHFLPLFVGLYSAAPYRMDFMDFHPEKALGFLPHELDYTHIRMIWRRWKKKSKMKVFGKSLTPFGPVWLDRLISGIFRLKGDFIKDFRLMDYLVCLMSTDTSPAFNGELDNDEKLKKDLSDLGVFDSSMTLYLFCRLRQYKSMGYSGFENRLYSQFSSLKNDLAAAVNLQQLITAFAFKHILLGEVKHLFIPDDPFVESERRQIIFAAAIGIPTFYVKINTKNQFLAKILKRTRHTRQSRRYHGYLRVLVVEYMNALVEMLVENGRDLIEAMQMEGVIRDTKERIHEPMKGSAVGNLTNGILKLSNSTSPLKVRGEEFNNTAETYYRNYLRINYINEAMEVLSEDLTLLDSWKSWREGSYNQPLLSILGGKRPQDFLVTIKESVISETASEEDVQKLIHLILLSVNKDIRESERSFCKDE